MNVAVFVFVVVLEEEGAGVDEEGGLDVLGLGVEGRAGFVDGAGDEGDAARRALRFTRAA